MLLQYLTIKDYGEHEIVIQNQDLFVILAEQRLRKRLKNLYKIKTTLNATHNCSAYLIGEQDHIQKANDDGEPSGTAGVPMLEVLKNVD